MRTLTNLPLDNDDYAGQVPESPVIASSKFRRDKFGILTVKASGPIITSEMVKEESEDDLD